MPKVILTDKLDQIVVDKLTEAGFEVKVAWDLPKEEIPNIIGEYDGIVIRSATKMKGELLEKATAMKVIVRAGVGLDNVDVETAMKKGIKVFNTPTATTNSVAELALALIMSSSRNVVKGTMKVRSDPASYNKFKKELFANEIDGKVLGIIGTGNIGTSLAKKAKALGMKTIGYDAFQTVNDSIELKPLEDVFKESDYISLHLPLTPETKNMISDAQFGLMKQGVVIVNCARGGIVDEEAAFKALESGKMACYATDVFEKEPPEADNKLLTHENVIITPHIGAQTKEGNYRASLDSIDKMIEAFQ